MIYGTSAHRGDLAILHRPGLVESLPEAAPTGLRHELAIVTSITRTGEVKCVRRIGGHTTAAGQNTSIPVASLRAYTISVIPATELRVANAVAAIVARHADPGTGDMAPYTSTVELLRDLLPWAIGDSTCLERVRAAAFAEVGHRIDQRCASCGVATYGDSRIAADDDGCPRAYCHPVCPLGVDFITDYPVGTQVMITSGFADGAIACIEAVSDAYPHDFDGTPHYAGRSYVLTLPYWGRRGYVEEIVRPCDPSIAARHRVRRGDQVR